MLVRYLSGENAIGYAPSARFPVVRVSWIPWVMLILLAWAAGCERKAPPASTSPAGRSVVVDLDAVAKAVGRMETITQQIRQANQSLLAQRAKLAQDMERQIKEAIEKAGDKPTDDQKKEIQQMRFNANQRMQMIDLEVRQKSGQVRATAITAFRDEVRPVAERLARERRAGVVLTSTEQVLWFDPENDITSDVIAALRSSDSSGRTSGTAIDPAPSATEPAQP